MTPQPSRGAILTPDSMSPGSPSSAFAISAINAKDGTVNIAGGNLTNVTNNFYVDLNGDKGN